MRPVHAAAADAPAEEAATYAKIAWRLIPFVFICYLCSYLDRINVSFAKLQMLQDLGLSDAIYGAGASMFFVGYLIFEVPSNLLLLRVGARRWIARIMVTWGLISAMMMFVRSPMSFYIARLLLGVAEAGFFPAILLYLTYWFPPSRRGKVIALFMTGIPMSGVIGGPLSGWIMHALGGVHGFAGWQWLFLLEGLPTMLLGCLAYIYLDDHVADAKWLSSSEKALIEARLKLEESPQLMHTLRNGLLHPRILLLSTIYFFYAMGLYGVTFWLPTLVKASGVSDPLNIGLLTALPYAAATVAMLLTGQSSDATGERRWHLAVPGVIGAVGLYFSVTYAHSTVVAMIFLTIATAAVITTISQFWVLPPAILGGTAAAAGLALANSVGSASGVVSPYVIGLIQASTGSTGNGVFGLAVSLLIASTLVIVALPAHLVNNKSKKERGAQAAMAPLATTTSAPATRSAPSPAHPMRR